MFLCLNNDHVSENNKFDSIVDNHTNSLDEIEVSDSCRCEPENCRNIIALDSLKILTQNIRSISANIHSFTTLLVRLSISLDIIILTECWLSCNPHIPAIDGYNSYSSNKWTNKNDGVVVYIKSNLANVIVIEPLFTDASCLQILIEKTTCILALYRPPSFKDITNFLSSLDQILAMNSSRSNIAVMGDINLDILNSNIDSKSLDYLNLSAAHGLLPAHNLVTHGKTSLDHVLLKTRLSALTVVIDSTVTDHNAVLLTLNKINIHSADKLIRKIDHIKLENQLNTTDFSYIFECTNANIALEYFNNSLNRAIQFSTSTYSVPHRLRSIKPWITPGILRCMRNRDRMYIKMKKSPDNETICITYKRYRNFCGRILKNLKRQYEECELNKARYNPKKMWNVIRNVTHTQKRHVSASPLLLIKSSSEESIEEVNKFFVKTGKTIAEEVARTFDSGTNMINDSPGNALSKSLVLLETDELEVDRLIQTLRRDCAIGVDGISSAIIYQYRKFFVRPLTFIFNLCIKTGVFPDLFKKALIHPIHKAGDADCITNYRPISVLPCLSKLLERIMNNCLKKYLEDNNILSNEQYGFRNNRSTNDAVFELTNHIVQAMDKGKKSVAIFLDLAKAFDTVSIPKLIVKLERIGVRDRQLKLFESYLTNRTQCVKINELISKELPVEFGVPQGSILGPTLFLVYVNEMCKLKITDGKLLAFADDTALIFTGETWDRVYGAAQIGFNMVTEWLADNTLSLNVDKTKIIQFSIKKSSKANIDRFIIAHSHKTGRNLTCTCPRLQNVTSIKYLGILIDDKLNFAPHIDLLTGRIRKLIFIFKHLRHVAKPTVLKNIYYALCQSLLGYCILSWGGACKTALIKLERAQRAVLKVSTFKPYRFPTKDLYEYCDVLTVRQLFILQIIMKQHSMRKTDRTSSVSSSRRMFRTLKLPPADSHRTTFSERFYYFLGRFIYIKINKNLDIDSSNKYECKQKVIKWLQKLSYDDTEKLIRPVM